MQARVPAAYREVFRGAVAQYAPAGYPVPAFSSALASILTHESGWNPQAQHRNANGSIDRGIAQINSAAHPEVTAAEAYNPGFAIPWASSFLAQKTVAAGSIRGGVAAYNPGNPKYANLILGPAGTAAQARRTSSAVAQAGGSGEALASTLAAGPGAALPRWAWVLLLGVGGLFVILAILRIL